MPFFLGLELSFTHIMSGLAVSVSEMTFSPVSMAVAGRSQLCDT